MATVLPDNPASQVQFFKNRAEAWVSEAASIGLSDAQALAVRDATLAAEAAWRRAYDAREAARMATQDWEFAAKTLREVGGSAIRTIKSFAEATGTPGVYSAASIPIPARPGPKARSPEERDNAVPRIRTCSARPDSHGNVVIEWTCGEGATKGAGFGMFYRVYRAIDGGERILLDAVGSPGAGKRTCRFTDTAIPIGTRTAEYAVTPMRGGGVGRSGPIAMVQFGGEGVGRGWGGGEAKGPITHSQVRASKWPPS